MKISNFWKTKFPSIKFPFIDDFALNIHEINVFLMFWSLMAFFGLHWPFWSFWPWMNFLSKDQPLVMKIKQNWAVFYNQMSKPNYESKLPIYSTVIKRPPNQYILLLFLFLKSGFKVLKHLVWKLDKEQFWQFFGKRAFGNLVSFETYPIKDPPTGTFSSYSSP